MRYYGLVRSAVSSSNEPIIDASVSTSIELDGSSRIRTGASFRKGFKRNWPDPQDGVRRLLFHASCFIKREQLQKRDHLAHIARDRAESGAPR